MRCEHPFLEDNGSSYLSRCRPPRRRRARVNRKMWRPKTITDSSARMHFGTYCFARTIVPSSTGKRADCSLFAHRLPKRMAQRKSERRSRSSEIQRPQTLTQLPILRHALFLQSTSQDRSHFSSYSATFRRSFETAPAASEQISALDCGGQASALKTHYNGA